MAYLVLAYPELTSESFDSIQRYREDNDKLFFKVVKPHFTLVFPVFDISEDKFIEEVKNKSLNFERFDFTIRCATINKDAFTDYFHAFLVPDEGYSRIVRLHDKLYSDILKHNLRLDIEYVPHIGIGNSQDRYQCKKMIDEWNDKDFELSGTISRLTIVRYEDSSVTTLEEIELK